MLDLQQKKDLYKKQKYKRFFHENFLPIKIFDMLQYLRLESKFPHGGVSCGQSLIFSSREVRMRAALLSKAFLAIDP